MQFAFPLPKLNLSCLAKHHPSSFDFFLCLDSSREPNDSHRRPALLLGSGYTGNVVNTSTPSLRENSVPVGVSSVDYCTAAVNKLHVELKCRQKLGRNWSPMCKLCASDVYPHYNIAAVTGYASLGFK